MRAVTIPYTEDLLVALGQSPEELDRYFRFWLAVKLFEIGRLSLGKAAELAGMKKIHFMDELGRRKIPIMNLDDDQFERDLTGSASTSSSTAAR